MSTSNGQKAPPAGKPGRFVTVATADGAEVHCDTIDPNSAQQRKRFVGGTLRAAYPDLEPDDWPDDDRRRLEADLLKLRAVPPGAPEPPAAPAAAEDPRAEALAKMPAAVRAEAERRLRDPNLLDLVGDDIGRLGVVGEPLNRLIIYLVGTSAQLPRPLAAIGRGASSSGKSFLCDRVSLLFPPEVVMHATGMTTNALYYFPPGELRHRFIVAGERSRIEDDDQAEATRALREMIEAGRLSKAVPVKEGDRIVTKLIQQPGPVAYVETTTRNNVFDEDANRCLLLNTDEGVEQTRRIIDATAAAAAGRDAGTAHLREVHHAIQRTVPRVDVLVPFVWAVARLYPTERLESRRDFRHLLQLVKAVALLHFRQRDRGPNGEVIATTADYMLAEMVGRAPLGAAASGVGDGARKFLVQLRDKFGDGEFTTTEAKRLPGLSPRTIEGRLHELNGGGAIEQTAAPKGKVPARWKLTGVNRTRATGCCRPVNK